jgi:hypothetical protein
MKKILVILLAVILFTSCAKEKVSGCGTCTGFGSVDYSSGVTQYYLPIRWDDGHSSNVQVDESTWVNTLSGDRICF